jgi:hypothetical protein
MHVQFKRISWWTQVGSDKKKNKENSVTELLRNRDLRFDLGDGCMIFRNDLMRRVESWNLKVKRTEKKQKD